MISNTIIILLTKIMTIVIAIIIIKTIAIIIFVVQRNLFKIKKIRDTLLLFFERILPCIEALLFSFFS